MPDARHLSALPQTRAADTRIPVPLYRIQLQREKSIFIRNHPCSTAEDAARIVREVIGSPDREHFVCVYLDGQLFAIGVEVVAIGDRFSVSATAAEIFKSALLCNAVGVTLVHNHPSGKATPSSADSELTAAFEIAGVLMGVQVVDHVVLGHDEAVSMRALDKMLVPLKAEFDTDRFLMDTARDIHERRRANA